MYRGLKPHQLMPMTGVPKRCTQLRDYVPSSGDLDVGEKMKRREIACKLTGDVGPCVDAHIIPESFFLFDKRNRKPTHIIPLDSSGRKTPSPKGIYDQGILTRVGEQHFSDFDGYAFSHLIKRGKEAKGYHDGKTVQVMEVEDFDYSLLKLFAISLLWRASVSTHHFFRRVQVGELS